MAERVASLQAAAAMTPSSPEEAAGPAPRPSVFELVAQDSLMAGLRPALGHLVKFLSTSRPQTFRNVNRFYDELYTVFEGMLQSHYLSKYGATFSENFYGLKRVLASDTTQGLDRKSRLRTLVIVVLVPYIRLKLGKLNTYLKDRLETGPRFRNPNLEKLCRTFVRLYPLLNAVIEMATFGAQLGYLVGKSESHSPWVWLSGARLLTMTAEDYARLYHTEPYHMADNPTVIARLLFLGHRLRSGLFHGFSRMIGFSLFFLQFLDWWFEQSDHKKTASLTALPTPKPPQMTYSAEMVHRLDPGLCPLCRKPRKNHTVLAISGYVFCYACIFRHLETHGVCPVTHIPASTKHLIRLYVEPAA